MSLLIATDLDQTLIYSPGAASRGPQRDARVVELLDGLVISLLSSRTERDLRELQRHAVLVPATTRTRAQYERIDLPAGSRYAIVASGGGILVDGEPDLAWAASVLARLRSTASPLAEVHELLDGLAARVQVTTSTFLELPHRGTRQVEECLVVRVESLLRHGCEGLAEAPVVLLK